MMPTWIQYVLSFKSLFGYNSFFKKLLLLRIANLGSHFEFVHIIAAKKKPLPPSFDHFCYVW